MAKRDLTEAQLEMLRRLPTDPPKLVRPIGTADALQRRGLAVLSGYGVTSGVYAQITPAGRALVEAADKLLAEQDAAERDFVASIMGTREDE